MPAGRPPKVKSPEVVWKPQPRQALLLACPIFECLYGGARGGGKTDGLIGDFANHASKHGQLAVGLIVRRKRTELLEMIERSKQIYTPLGAKFFAQDKVLKFPNKARLTFAYLENDADADNYQGWNLSYCGVEEMGSFPDPKPIFKLMATLRLGPPKIWRFRATANPGGAGHLWIRKRYIDPAPKGGKIIHDIFENPFTKIKSEISRIYIPSNVTDNIYCNNPQYIAQLQLSAGSRLLKAWLHGDWSVIEGAFFEEWEEEKHVIKPFVIPGHWTRFCSADWGSAAPFAIHWWAVVPDDANVQDIFYKIGGRDSYGMLPESRRYRGDLPPGAIVCYREWYGSPNHSNTGLKLHAEEVARGIVERERYDPRNDMGRADIAYRVIDPAACKNEGGPSIAERMGYAPNYVFWQPADNMRVGRRGNLGGWDTIRARLKGDEYGRPMIYFFNTCEDVIRTLPVMQHDPDNMEDVMKGEDHCFAAGTLVDTAHGSVPIEKIPSEGLVHSVDSLEFYHNWRMTRAMAEVVRLHFEDGRQVTCTPDHKFLADLDTWRYAKDLQGTEAMCSQSLSRQRSKSSTASGTIFAGVTFRRKVSAFTSWFGNITTAPGRRSMMCITETMTGPTMQAGTWSCLMSQPTMDSGTEVPEAGSLPRPLGLEPLIGTIHRKAGLGTRNITSVTPRVLGWLRWLRYASSAALSTRRSKAGLPALSSVTRIVKHVRCVRVERLSAKMPVYCITVPSNETFSIEGGILVHNCPDSVRYACMSRPYTLTVEPKREDRIVSVGPSNQLTINDVMDNEPRKDAVRFERIR